MTDDDIQLGSQFKLEIDELSDLVAHQDKKALADLGGVEGVAKQLHSDMKKGLGESEIDSNFAERRAKYGVNRFPQPPTTSLLSFWLESFEDLTMIILCIAAVVSIIVAIITNVLELGEVDPCTVMSGESSEDEGMNTDWVEGVGILIAIVLVSTVTAGNNYSKELKFRALAAKEQDVPTKVMRNGEVQMVSILELNVGDVIFIDTGDQIPADGLFIEGYDLRVDESQMNGEPVAAKKNVEEPFLLSGTKVTDGSGKFIATSVGPNSEWGKTLASLTTKSRPTPLQENLDDMATKIGKLGMAVAALVFVVSLIYWFIDNFAGEDKYECYTDANKTTKVTGCITKDMYEANKDLCKIKGFSPKALGDIVEYLIISITIIVVAVPEGLPLAVTISLAYSMKQMFKDNNLVRHLKACETMSNCTNICSDKTGTLTENRMTVVRGWLAGRAFGAVPLDERPEGKTLDLISEGVAMNSAVTSSFSREDGIINVVGNKTEGALLVFLDSCGVNFATVRNECESRIYQRFTFSSAKKRMSTLLWADATGAESGVIRMHTKGAPEIMLAHSKYYYDAASGEVRAITAEIVRELEALQAEYATDGLRTLCLAYREFKAPTEEGKLMPRTLGVDGIEVPELEERAQVVAEEKRDSYDIARDPVDGLYKFDEAPDSDMILFALVGIQDPVRPEVPRAVADCQAAGITVRMVTGDNITTAKSIAKQCHILTVDGVAIEGPAFSKLTDAELDEILPRLQVIARCSPTDKQKLVHRLITLGEVVAVTGDGTNDVPALKEADVGMAMGIRGTDIAKQASDIVIMDDNFQSIVKAVMWGRNVYDNIRKFLQFQLTVNVAALIICFIGAVTRRGTPLTAIQLLWVNLIMDTLAALALGTEKPTKHLLERKPFGRYDPLLSPYMIRFIAAQSIFQVAVLLGILYGGAKMSWLHAECAFASKEEPINSGKRCTIDGRPASNDEIDDHTLIVQTVIFNTFVFCQIFNEINARKVNGERRVFEGLFSNKIFVGILFIIIALQAIFVIIGGPVLNVVSFPGINGTQWLTCIVIAFITIPIGFLVSFIPVPAVKPHKFNKDTTSKKCCDNRYGSHKPQKYEHIDDVDVVDVKQNDDE